MRKANKARLRNRSVKTSLRNIVKKANDAIALGDQTKTVDATKLATKKLDQAASKGYIHRNKAARLKSRMAKRANKAAAAATTAK
jgi:small subunit ribosomal protein S20